MTDTPVEIDDRAELTAWLADSSHEGQIVRTTLKASNRVIARVTDGIYRQPAAALRELISNAWDADAHTVTIITDTPRFSRIYVRDDGVGMSYETLARVFHSIGGSAKRQEDGQHLGISAPGDPEHTAGGRPFIGKIGIGLFSVSQLARRFEIITKVAGADYRLLAQVRLRQYTEETPDGDELEEEMFSGEVLIRREATSDLDAHGTDIILDDIKPRVRDILRSSDRWKALAEREAAFQAGDLDTWSSMRVEPPAYHSGYLGQIARGRSSTDVLDVGPKLPWLETDPAGIRMSRLVDAVEGEFSKFDRPDLANTLDEYLSMIWSLGLSAPVPYVDKHPFDLKQNGSLQLLWRASERGKGVEIVLEGDQTVREAIRDQAPGNPDLVDGIDPLEGFSVLIDGLELKRPIRFRHHQTDWRGLQRAVMMVGRLSPDLSQRRTTHTGGSLYLEGYLFWTGRIIPKENNGVLVRIRGASGALFDQRFFSYQVSEQTRLRQITSELFVERGLDAALNIDRESFNYSHPHYQLVALWLHNSIRQLTNRLKDEAGRLRQSRRLEEEVRVRSRVDDFVENLWSRQRGSEPLPDVVITRTEEDSDSARRVGAIALTRSLIPSLDLGGGPDREAQAIALVRVLSAFNLLDDLSYQDQQVIVASVLQLFQIEA